MNEAIAWATFAGAWLLVAGPLYQGSVELNELDFDREGIQGKAAAVQAAQDRPSAWWWLLPPVMYVLRWRWYKALQQAMLAQLTKTQREQMTGFQSKATGWFTVAAGATLLAAGETWQIAQHYGWPVWLFWLLVVVMLAGAVLNTAVQMISNAHTRRRGALAAVATVLGQRGGAVDERGLAGAEVHADCAGNAVTLGEEAARPAEAAERRPHTHPGCGARRRDPGGRSAVGPHGEGSEGLGLVRARAADPHLLARSGNEGLQIKAEGDHAPEPGKSQRAKLLALPVADRAGHDLEQRPPAERAGAIDQGPGNAWLARVDVEGAIEADVGRELRAREPGSRADGLCLDGEIGAAGPLHHERPVAHP